MYQKWRFGITRTLLTFIFIALAPQSTMLADVSTTYRTSSSSGRSVSPGRSNPRRTTNMTQIRKDMLNPMRTTEAIKHYEGLLAQVKFELQRRRMSRQQQSEMLTLKRSYERKLQELKVKAQEQQKTRSRIYSAARKGQTANAFKKTTNQYQASEQPSRSITGNAIQSTMKPFGAMGMATSMTTGMETESSESEYSRRQKQYQDEERAAIMQPTRGRRSLTRKKYTDSNVTKTSPLAISGFSSSQGGKLAQAAQQNKQQQYEEQQRRNIARSKFRSAGQRISSGSAAALAFEQSASDAAIKKNELQKRQAEALQNARLKKTSAKARRSRSNTRRSSQAERRQETTDYMREMGDGSHITNVASYANEETSVDIDPTRAAQVQQQINALELKIATAPQSEWKSLFTQRTQLYKSIGKKAPQYDFNAMKKRAATRSRFASAASRAGTQTSAADAFNQEGSAAAERRTKEERQMQAAMSIAQQQTARDELRDAEIARQERKQETADYVKEMGEGSHITDVTPYGEAAPEEVTMELNPMMQAQAKKQLEQVNIDLVYATSTDRGQLYKNRNLLYKQLSQVAPRYNPEEYRAKADAQRRKAATSIAAQAAAAGRQRQELATSGSAISKDYDDDEDESPAFMDALPEIGEESAPSEISNPRLSLHDEAAIRAKIIQIEEIIPVTLDKANRGKYQRERNELYRKLGETPPAYILPDIYNEKYEDDGATVNEDLNPANWS